MSHHRTCTESQFATIDHPAPARRSTVEVSLRVLKPSPYPTLQYWLEITAQDPEKSAVYALDIAIDRTQWDYWSLYDRTYGTAWILRHPRVHERRSSLRAAMIRQYLTDEKAFFANIAQVGEAIALTPALITPVTEILPTDRDRLYIRGYERIPGAKITPAWYRICLFKANAKA